MEGDVERLEAEQRGLWYPQDASDEAGYGQTTLSIIGLLTELVFPLIVQVLSALHMAYFGTAFFVQSLECSVPRTGCMLLEQPRQSWIVPDGGV